MVLTAKEAEDIVDVENFWEAEVSKEITKAIDREIVCELLVQSGWTLVYLPTHHATAEMIHWCESTCVDEWKLYIPNMIFKNKQDAIMFKLKWVAMQNMDRGRDKR